MVKIHLLKNKKSIFVFLGVLLLLVIGLVFSIKLYKQDNVPEYLQKIYLNQKISYVGDKHYKVGSTDIYVAQISVGNTELYQIFEKWIEIYEGREWENDKYRFFSTDENPKLLKDVGTITPPQDASQALNTDFFLQDITGDGIDELFIRVLNSASNLSEWEILKLEDSNLVNITIKGQKDNPTWVTFDNAGNKGNLIWLDWHGSDQRGRSFYKLEGNELVLDIGVRIKFVTIDDYDYCDVSSGKDYKDFTFIERIDCSKIRRDENNSYNFDRYFHLTSEQILFLNQVYKAKSDSKLSTLAQTYSDHCDSIIDTATLSRVKDFNGLLQNAKDNNTLKTTPEGKVIAIPCSKGVYQDSYLPVFYDGNIYTPMTFTHIDSDGKRTEQNTAESFNYNTESDVFSYHSMGNGMNSCWEDGEYKLIDHKLVLQKIIEDSDCEDADGKQDESNVIYDVNNQ